jgi:hypothetical protein
MKFIIAVLLASSLTCFARAEDAASPIQVETFIQTHLLMGRHAL